MKSSSPDVTENMWYFVRSMFLRSLVHKRNFGFKVRILILSKKVGCLLRFNEVGEKYFHVTYSFDELFDVPLIKIQ